MKKSADVDSKNYIELLEQQLYEKEKEVRILKGAIDASRFGVSLADSKGNALMVNPAHSRITGVPSSSIVGKNYNDIEIKTKAPSCTLQVLEKDAEVYIIQRPTSGREYMVYGTPFIDPVTGEKYVVCNNIDDTEVGFNKQEIESAIMTTYERELKNTKRIEKVHEKIVFISSKMENVINLCSKIAPFDATVLLEGGSGTGKELLTEYIVSNSDRNEKPLIKINCAAIPDNLLESELFGYEPNSFTNASNKGKHGILEMADQGTVMLDEIGELPLPTQAKLLRFIQEKEFYRIGGTTPIKVDVRIIAATNQNLQDLVKEKLFRQDLYYRLCVVPITIPALNERREDIPFLIRFFLDKYNTKYNQARKISNEAVEYLNYQDYPGNVRELENCIERIVLLASNNIITLEDVLNIQSSFGIKACNLKNNYRSLKTLLEEYEKNIIERCIEEYKDNSEVCTVLGISQPTLSRRLAYYGIK